MPDEIIGTSAAVARLRAHLPLLAKGPHPIILSGEEGTGKAFLASHIHAAGPRAAAPAESLNFSLLSERDQRIGLLGAEPPELTTTKRSVLERKTTVVLKHIDHANGYLQERLAEALAAARILRLGATETHPVAARVIFTFRRRIVQLEKSKTLTPRLLQTLYPLKKIQLPPLRQRRDDIPLLAREYALKIYRHHQDRGGACIRGIAMDGTLDEELEQLLRIHRWEGNIRDLIAFVRSLAMFPFREELLEREKMELFSMVGMIEAGEEFSLPSGLAGVERALVDRAVHTSHRHSTGVAKLLGISERALGRRISGVRRS